jgi:hypothetical protein
MIRHIRRRSRQIFGTANQYDLWPRFPDRARVGDNLILVLDDVPDLHATIRAPDAVLRECQSWGACDPQARRRRDWGASRVVAAGWRGGWPSQPAP